MCCADSMNNLLPQNWCLCTGCSFVLVEWFSCVGWLNLQNISGQRGIKGSFSHHFLLLNNSFLLLLQYTGNCSSELSHHMLPSFSRAHDSPQSTYSHPCYIQLPIKWVHQYFQPFMYTNGQLLNIPSYILPPSAPLYAMCNGILNKIGPDSL